MISTRDAKVGQRVRWKSLDENIPSKYGEIVYVIGKRFAVRWDNGEEITYSSDDAASCIFVSK